MLGLLPDPLPDELTLMPAEADEPEYVAVIVPPDASCDPLTGNVAVAVPADPIRATDPNTADPVENSMAPLGVMLFAFETVAIRKTVSVDATVLSLVTRLIETP